MYYVDSTGNLFTSEITPNDAVATPEEISAWEASRAPGPREALAALDAEFTLTQRNLREFILLTVEALKTGAPVDLSVLPGVQVVAAVEAEASALRAQL